MDAKYCDICGLYYLPKMDINKRCVSIPDLIGTKEHYDFRARSKIYTLDLCPVCIREIQKAVDLRVAKRKDFKNTVYDYRKEDGEYSPYVQKQLTTPRELPIT